jgi:DNA-binding MarR family transcriptional regulator
MLKRYGKFTYAISEISKNLQKVSQDEMQKFGLHGSYAKYVLALKRNGSVTAAKLSELCDRNKADVSRAVNTLEREGVIEKLVSDTNYRVRIRLTERGVMIGEKLSERLKLVLSHVSGEIAEEELASFYRTLETISQNLQKLSSFGLPE